jgi:hypothetical protein
MALCATHAACFACSPNIEPQFEQQCVVRLATAPVESGLNCCWFWVMIQNSSTQEDARLLTQR